MRYQTIFVTSISVDGIELINKLKKQLELCDNPSEYIKIINEIEKNYQWLGEQYEIALKNN